MAYTDQGRRVVYKDVRQDDAALAEMLKAGGGRRAVPIIDDNGKVTIGFGGT